MNKIQRLSVTMMMMLMATATWAYKVNMVNPSGPTITAKYGSSTAIEYGTTEVTAGLTVILTVEEDNSKYLTGLTVQSDVPAEEASSRRTAPSIAIEGDVEVRQTGDFTYEFTMPIGNVTITPTFGERTSIENATVTLRDAANTTTTTTSETMTWQFDWLPHLPEVYQVAVSSTTLTAGTDYTVSSFSSITNVEASNRTITITGKGKYNGTKTVSYNITPRDISGASVQFSPTTFVYNKSHQAPEANTVAVYLLGKQLTIDTDYENVNIPTASINAGTYPITVTGKGNFEGTASNTYTISKKPISECTYTGPTVFTYNGNDLRPTITTIYQVKDGDVALTLDTDYTISYSAAGDESKDVGTYTMTITAKDASNYSGSKTISYSINSSGFAISAIADQVYTGSEIKPTIEVKDGTTTLTKGTHYDVIYSNNINVGTAKVYAVGLGSYNGKTGEATFNITPKSVEGLTITLSGTGYDTTNKRFTYNASTQKPTVTVKDGDTKLTENKDYTLVNAGGLNVGTAYKATITGLGNYDDETTKDSENYSITALSFDNDNTDITLSTTDYVYDGTAKTPTVQQVKIGDIVIPSTDYTVEYSENTYVNSTSNTPTVTIKPRNIATSGDPLYNLSGSGSTTFTIAQRPISDMTISLDETSFTYNGLVQTPTVTITGLTLDTDYTLSYSSHDTGGNPTSTDVGTYTVTITGQGNYTGSIDKTYVINQSSSDNTFVVTVTGTYIYNGSAYTPEGSATEGTGQAVVVKKKKGTTPETYDVLTPGTDYSLSYRDNTNAGTAKVTATGKGNYQFVQTGEFTIQPKEITAGMATLSGAGFVSSGQSFVYNGALQKPTVTITDTDLEKTLVEGTDYTLVNAGGTNVGTSYNATITGIGNYKTGAGGLVKNYSITALSLTDAAVTLDPLQSYVYDGTEKRPGVQQVKVGNVVVPAADYAVTYPKDATPTDDDNYNVNAGTNTAKVYINPSATGNLSGSKTQNFSITKKPLTSEMITLSSADSDWNSYSFVYNGSQRTPTVTVSDIPTGFTTSIIQASDYTITNAGGTAVGVYYVTVAATAAGNYSGTIKVPYSIVSDNSETDVTITLDDNDDLTYTGNPITRTITVTKGTAGLTENTDYEVIYNNNINVGQATITILGKGNYHFVKYVPFSISKRPLTADMISLSANNFTYNGSAQKPAITITYNGVRTEGLDYKLTNTGQTDVGTGYYEVEGVGNFTGTLKSSSDGMSGKRYTVSALDISSTSTVVTSVEIVLYPLADPVYNGTAKEPGVQKVVITKTDESQIVLTSGYSVGYSNNKDVAVGTTAPTVTISGANFGESTASTTFAIQPKPLTDGMVAFSPSGFTYTGEVQKPTVTVTDVALPGENKTVANTNYTVDWPENVTDPGEKEVQIVGKNNYSGTIVKKYVINKIGDDDITVAIGGTYTYNGLPQTPHDADANHTNNITVTKNNTTPLSLDIDYSVAYLNNTKAGIATAVITGKGNYSFTIEKTFTIAKRNLSDATIALTGIPTAGYYTYDGTLKKPGVSVTDVNGTTSIISSKDYTITNEGNINASNTDYTVTISSNDDGNYTGEVTRTYKIHAYALPATTSVTLDQSTFVYDGSAKTPNVLVVKIGELIVPTYSTDYSNNTAAAQSTATLAPTVTVTASGNFSGSITKTFNIQPKPVTSDMIVIAEAEMNLEYTGGTLKPNPTIRDLKDPNDVSTNVIEADDYTLTNDGGVAVGNYEVKIVGKRNYTGTATKQYSIVAKASASAFDIAAIADQTYSGSALTPAVTVYKAGTTTDPLTLGTHYSVTYSDNINQGTATVTVTGVGNYAGTKTQTFKINKKPLASDMVTLSTPTTFTYNGNIQKPTVTVSDGNAMKEADYVITNADHSDVGNYTITVTATDAGNYSGSVEKNYAINPLSISEASVSLEQNVYTYDGQAKRPAVSEVKVGTFVVPTSGSYTIRYDNDDDSTNEPDLINQGTKKVIITGTSNFTGEVTKNYTISPKPVTSDMIILSSGNLAYTGTLLKPEVTVKDGAKLLLEGETKDYTLVNAGAVNVGTYSVSINGKGNYTGQASKSYNIIAVGASGFTVAEIADVVYEGVAIEPVLSVKDGETVLTKGTHYNVTYSDNKNVGQATVAVTGIVSAGYSGTTIRHFNITPKPLTAAMVELTTTTFDYNGALQKPGVTVSDGSAMTASDYMITNGGGINANDTSNPNYTVTVAGTNNYQGSVTKTYTILPLDIADAAITLYQLSDKAYDGTAKQPGVREVVTGGNIVVPTVGYDVTYSNNVNAGTAQVTVTGKNNFKGETSTTFTIERKTVTSSMITLSEENFNYNGEVQKPDVTISDKNGDDERITADDYTLSNPGGTAVGNYKVKITGKRNYTGEAEKQFSILEKDAVINNFKITLSETSVEYTGEEQKPDVTVKDGDKKLNETVDYDVVFSNNTNAGTATVTVTGKGNYAGTRTTTFEITKKPLTAAMISISGYTTTTGFTYNGAHQAPTVEVRDGSALTASDYVITNNGGTNHGTYHVIITGTGNYSGEFDYTFDIAKRSIEGAKVTLYELTSYVYDGKAKKPGVKEVAFNEDVIPTAGYSVAYSNNTNAGTATVTITGQGNYAGELTTTFTIEKKTLTNDMIVLSNDEYVYNGGNQKPMVTLMDGETEMELDADYTLTNQGGTSVGTYDVIANGKGNYNGMAVKQFSIITKGIGAFEVSLSSEQVVYNGSEHRPTATVKDGEKTLTAGSEYTVSYTDNVNAGTATVTITGQGEYSGTSTKTFIIKPKALTEDMVYLSSSSYTYNTLQQKPTVTVSDQSFLTYNDYTLTNDGGVDHGEYDVVVIGRNNYVGTVIKHFSILPLSIENAKVTLYEMASYVYDGKAKNPGVREVTIGNTIVPTSSYTTEISANINVGTVTVTVTGLENFKGTATATFDITPKPLTEQMVILSEELIYYTGETLKPTVEVKDGETMLTEETDYQLTNEGGVDPGIYEVVATGIGNYKGTITKTFKIERSDISIDITAEDSEHGEFGVKLIVSQISEENLDVRVTGITIPEADKSKVMSLTIPATVEAEGVTYPITEIAAGAFADVEQLSDLHLPETEETLTVGDNAIPATTTVHTSLALLDDYALMPSLGVNFRAGKVMTTVMPKNQFWTFSSGVDVYVPEGVTVFTVQERSNTAVAIVELTNSALTSSGTRMIKSNNGVLLQGSNQASYDVVACPRRMSSGTVISTSDHKDYGEENCLVPVIEATHYETDYYILKNNKFSSIRLEGADVKVPAGKAVLYLPSVAEGRLYSDVLDMIDGATGIRITESGMESHDVWYDLSGRRVEKPTKKGIYIHNGKKVMIR